MSLVYANTSHIADFPNFLRTKNVGKFKASVSAKNLRGAVVQHEVTSRMGTRQVRNTDPNAIDLLYFWPHLLTARDFMEGDRYLRAVRMGEPCMLLLFL